MPFLVDSLVAVTLKLNFGAERDSWFSSADVSVIDEFVAVIASVCEQPTPVYFDVLQQRDCVTDVTELSLTDHEVYRIIVGIYYRMDLGGSSSLVVPDLVGNAPFLAFALC